MANVCEATIFFFVLVCSLAMQRGFCQADKDACQAFNTPSDVIKTNESQVTLTFSINSTACSSNTSGFSSSDELRLITIHAVTTTKAAMLHKTQLCQILLRKDGSCSASHLCTCNTLTGVYNVTLISRGNDNERIRLTGRLRGGKKFEASVVIEYGHSSGTIEVSSIAPNLTIIEEKNGGSSFWETSTFGFAILGLVGCVVVTLAVVYVVYSKRKGGKTKTHETVAFTVRRIVSASERERTAENGGRLSDGSHYYEDITGRQSGYLRPSPSPKERRTRNGYDITTPRFRELPTNSLDFSPRNVEFASKSTRVPLEIECLPPPSEDIYENYL